jgi:hypothetical protein
MRILKAMKPTIDHRNDFLAHKQILGVSVKHNEFVKVVVGEHEGNKGSLVSVEELGEDPLFLLELESGFDILVRQSQIERFDL